MEYGGLKPILPFLGGRSDAARRVVIRLHASHPWGPHGFHNDAPHRYKDRGGSIFGVHGMRMETTGGDYQ